MVSRGATLAGAKARSDVQTQRALVRPGGLLGLHIIVIALCVFSAFPLLWMLSTAFKGPTEIFTSSPRLIPHDPSLANFSEATESKPVVQWAINSGLFAILTTLLRLAVVLPASFALARLTFPMKRFVLMVIIGTMIIPSVVTLIPNYLLIVDLGWINSMQGIVVPTVAGSAFFVFFLRQHMLQIPQEILDAAMLDGAGL